MKRPAGTRDQQKSNDAAGSQGRAKGISTREGVYCCWPQKNRTSSSCPELLQQRRPPILSTSRFRQHSRVRSKECPWTSESCCVHEWIPDWPEIALRMRDEHAEAATIQAHEIRTGPVC